MPVVHLATLSLEQQDLVLFAAPTAQDEPSSNKGSSSTSSRSCGTPGPRGVLFEVTNSATSTGKAFPDTPYPKSAFNKVGLGGRSDCSLRA